MDHDALVDLLSRTADAVAEALDGLREWRPAGTRPGQYTHDLVADEAARRVLQPSGVAVLSEETGWQPGRDPAVTVVVDPVDGSTNAARGVPWFATSLCAVADGAPQVALVVDHPGGRRFEAVRGRGARRDGRPVRPSACRELGESLVALSGWPPAHLGWRQFRALGALALDLCAVADGTVDAYVDCSDDAHGPWDYLGALLVCEEAGAVVHEAGGRELVVLDAGARRTPVAAGTPELATAALAARRSLADRTPRRRHGRTLG